MAEFCPTCGRIHLTQTAEHEGRLEGELLESLARGLQAAYSRTVWRGKVPGQRHGLDWEQMSESAQASWRAIAQEVGQEFDIRLRRASTACDTRPCSGGFERPPGLLDWCGRPATHVAVQGDRWAFLCHPHALDAGGEVLTVADWFARTEVVTPITDE